MTAVEIIAGTEVVVIQQADDDAVVVQYPDDVESINVGDQWATPGNSLPLMDGVAAVGVSPSTFSREDHRHPTDTALVAKAGDTMTGDLTISKTTPYLALRRPDGTSVGGLLSYAGSALHWEVQLGMTGADDFRILRYNDAGTPANTLVLSRADGTATFSGGTAINTNGDVVFPAAGNHYFGATNATGQMVFLAGDGSTPRITIDSSGAHFGGNPIALGAATPGSTPGYTNTTTGHSIRSDGSVFHSIAAGPALYVNANADGYLVPFYRSGNLVGSINITTTTTAYNTSSDERLKTDLQEFSAGKIIDDTRVYSFTWKSGASNDRSYGVSAQQASEVYPQAVFHDEATDWWGVDYSKYIPILLQEIKALRARVAQLETGAASKPV